MEFCVQTSVCGFPHKIFSVLWTCGFLDKDWNGRVGGWMGLVGCLLGYDVDAG